VGDYHDDEVYMLCTDGFRNKLLESEIKVMLSPSKLSEEAEMKRRLVEMTELSKKRGETDNITSIVVKFAS
jgi:serine/threonine protein phosphatase PrpC